MQNYDFSPNPANKRHKNNCENLHYSQKSVTFVAQTNKDREHYEYSNTDKSSRLSLWNTLTEQYAVGG